MARTKKNQPKDRAEELDQLEQLAHQKIEALENALERCKDELILIQSEKRVLASKSLRVDTLKPKLPSEQFAEQWTKGD